MSVSVIQAVDPEIIPPVPERVLDNFYLRMGTYEGLNFPTINLLMEVGKYGVDADGIHVSKEPPIPLVFDDLFALSETDPDVRDMMNAIIKVAKNKLIELGLAS